MATINNSEIELATASNLVDIAETIIGVIGKNPVSIIKFITLLGDKTFTTIQKIPYLQLSKYFDGVKRVEESLGERCKLSAYPIMIRMGLEWIAL